MEWKIYIKSGEKSYRVLKIRQSTNLDITIIPKNAVYFPREIIAGLSVGDQIELEYDRLDEHIDHYSAHAWTGQRHVKLDPQSPALEPIIGHQLGKIEKPVPLVTVLASANEGSQEEPSSKWYGYVLPKDVNYLVMNIIAIPKNSRIQYHQDFTIHNDRKTKETFDNIPIEMRNCTIILFIRTTNHELTNFPHNILFQQVEGKTVTISRVEMGKVTAQVSQLEIK